MRWTRGIKYLGQYVTVLVAIVWYALGSDVTNLGLLFYGPIIFGLACWIFGAWQAKRNEYRSSTATLNLGSWIVWIGKSTAILSLFFAWKAHTHNSLTPSNKPSFAFFVLMGGALWVFGRGLDPNTKDFSESIKQGEQ